MTRGAGVAIVDITKSFGGVHALRGIDLEILPGEVHGILGPNGSGKSTLMKIIAGLESPDGGTVHIDGERMKHGNVLESRRAGVVLMPQELTTVPRMTVAQNVLLGVEPRRFGVTTRRDAVRIAADALGRAGLDVSLDSEVESLSATQQRLLMMAAALAGGARVLILDEPTAGLPFKETRHVIDATARVAQSGCTVLLITHRLEQLRELSDRVTVLRDGQIADRFYEDKPSREDLVRAISGGADAAGDNELTAGEGVVAVEEPETLMCFDAVSHRHLTEFSYEIRRGDLVGIVGLPGSGVEELVAVSNGELHGHRGMVRAGSQLKRLRSPHDAARLGVVFVSGHRKRMVMADRSIATHVGLPSMARRAKLGWVRQKVENSTTRVALDAFAVRATVAQPLRTLSGGNQQRALMARSVAGRASVIVAHEPTVGVDVGARELLRNHLKRFASRNAVLVVSSDPDEVVGLCEVVVCLRDGTVSEILSGPAITTNAVLHAIA